MKERADELARSRGEGGGVRQHHWLVVLGSVTRSVHYECYAMFIQQCTQSAHRKGDIVITEGVRSRWVTVDGGAVVGCVCAYARMWPGTYLGSQPACPR